MFLATRVRLVLAEEPEVCLEGVKISLYDHDVNDEDDLLGTGLTDAEGEVLFGYDSEGYTDREDQPPWRTESLPDLYVIVYDEAGSVVLNTVSEIETDKLQRLIKVQIPRQAAINHRLIPS